MTNIDPLGQIEDLIGPSVTDFPSTPDTYSAANRPQDIRYEFPERSAESHGVADDTPTTGYQPEQVQGDARIVTDTGETTRFEELVAPNPVATYEVPNPLTSVIKSTRLTIPFRAFELYSGSAGAIDRSTIRQLVSTDDTRTRALIQVSLSGATPVSTQYFYAVSPTPDFTDFVVLSASSTTLNQFEILGTKGDWFGALIPQAAYDATKVNDTILSVLCEYASLLDKLPSDV